MTGGFWIVMMGLQLMTIFVSKITIFVWKIKIFVLKMIIIKKMLFNKTCVPLFDPLYPHLACTPIFRKKSFVTPFSKMTIPPSRLRGGGWNYEVPYQPYSQVHNNQRMSDWEYSFKLVILTSIVFLAIEFFKNSHIFYLALY